MNAQNTTKSGTAFKQALVNELPRYDTKRKRRKKKRKGMGGYYD